MAYNDDNIINNNESIFSTLQESQNQQIQSELSDIRIHDNNIIKKFFEAVSEKLNEFKLQKTQKDIEKIFSEVGPFLRFLYDYGCTAELKNDGIIIVCESLNKKGTLTVNKDKSVELDDDAKEIFNHVANLINKTNSLTEILNKYEEQGFYPVGELKTEKAIIDDKECEVLVGTLENDKKETKTIYYYNGKEVFLS